MCCGTYQPGLHPERLMAGTYKSPIYIERKMIGTKPPWNYVPAVNLPGCILNTFRSTHIFNSETHWSISPRQGTRYQSLHPSLPGSAQQCSRPSHLPGLLKMGGTVYLPTFIVDPYGK